MEAEWWQRFRKSWEKGIKMVASLVGGRSCTFSHDLKDDKRRCYHCGSQSGERPKVQKLEEDRRSEASASPQKRKDASRETTVADPTRIVGSHFDREKAVSQAITNIYKIIQVSLKRTY